jgi:hypothetical protein
VSDPTKAAWITRVLGVTFAGSAGGQSAIPPQSTTTQRRGIVQQRGLLLRWRLAQRKLADNLDALARSVLAREDVQEDPRFEEVREVVSTLPGLIPSFGGKLEDLLDAGINAGENAPKKLIDDTIAAVEAYRGMLKDEPKLTALEKFGADKVGVRVELASALDSVLMEIETELRQTA